MLVLIVFSLPVFSVFTCVYAADEVVCANSNICAAPPPGFKLMTSFIREMATAIKTVGTRDPYIGKYVSPSWFQAGQFVPPKESLLGKFTRNIKQKLQSILAITAVFTDLRDFGGVKDFAGWFVILFRNKVFFRDYKALMDIDSLISDKKYELGIGWGWAEKLNEANFKMFQDILDKYGPDGEWLFKTAKIEDDTTYRHIIMLMTRINSSLKTFLAVQRIKQFRDEFTPAKSDIPLIFNYDLITGMKAEYTCVKACDPKRNAFQAGIKKIGKTFGSGATDVGKTIKDASKRFAAAMWFGSKEDKEALKKREQELLRSQFGLKTTAATQGILGLKNYRDQIKAAGKKITNGWNDIKQDLWADNQRAAMFSGITMTNSERRKITNQMAEDIQTLKKNYDNKNISNGERAAQNLVYNCITPSQYIDPIYAGLTASMDIIYDNASRQSQSMIIANNTDVTSYFSSILTIMHTTITTVIGKRGVPNSLIQNLWDACKAQCKNAWWKCFY